MSADATLFSNNDLTEPGYGGQVVASSISNSPYIPHTVTIKRRLFINITSNNISKLWIDQYGYSYSFQDLRDIVIVNRGIEK